MVIIRVFTFAVAKGERICVCELISVVLCMFCYVPIIQTTCISLMSYAR